MAIRKLKPTTPGQRFKIVSAFDTLTASTPEKSLLAPIKKSGGRNNTGKMTIRYRGGGHKRRYRIVDFTRRIKQNVEATVKTIEYDPNRSANIALIEYKDGEKSYIIAPAGLQPGSKVMSGEKALPEVGHHMYLKNIPLGTVLHNIELTPGRGGVMARSAGAGAQIVAKDGKYAVIKLPSGETRMVLQSCMATVGSVSNADHALLRMGKAGGNRWRGRRPRTRGVAMNPVDHPMGGGEGKASGGLPRSRKGLMAKGLKTRSKKKASNKYIIERKKK